MSLTVASGSMEPLISAGDRVHARAYAGEQRPRIGDVVLLHGEQGWVVHRIIGRIRRGGEVFYRQKGDAGRRSSVVPASAVVARIIRVEKDGREIELVGRNQRSRLAGMGFALLDGVMRRGRRMRGASSAGEDSVGKASVSRLCRRVESLMARLAAGRYPRRR